VVTSGFLFLLSECSNLPARIKHRIKVFEKQTTPPSSASHGAIFAVGHKAEEGGVDRKGKPLPISS